MKHVDSHLSEFSVFDNFSQLTFLMPLTGEIYSLSNSTSRYFNQILSVSSVMRAPCPPQPSLIRKSVIATLVHLEKRSSVLF